jgi:hypothetical protein
VQEGDFVTESSVIVVRGCAWTAVGRPRQTSVYLTMIEAEVFQQQPKVVMMPSLTPMAAV